MCEFNLGQFPALKRKQQIVAWRSWNIDAD